MKYKIINDEEMKSIRAGSIPQLATVLAVGAIALITITIFKLYQSTKGESNFGNGFNFEWEIED